MNLQSKKARVSIAALGVTALIAGGGWMVAMPASAAGVTLAFGPTNTSATITDVPAATDPSLTYGVKATGLPNTTDPLYLGVISTPSSGAALSAERVAGNGTPTANAAFPGVTYTAGALAVLISTTAGSTTATLDHAPTDVAGPTAYSLANTLIKIGTGATAEYATVATHSASATTLVLSAPATSTQATAALASAGAAATNNFFVPVLTGVNVVVPGYTSADSVYFGATIPGDYTFRLYQNHNASPGYDEAQDDSTPTFTLHVKDVTAEATNGATTADDVDFGLTAQTAVDLGRSVTATATLGTLTKTDTRGGVAGVGTLGTNLGARLRVLNTDTGTTTSPVTASTTALTFDGTSYTTSFVTSVADGSVAVQPELSINAGSTFTGYAPAGQKTTTIVASNGVTTTGALAVTAVAGSVKLGPATATIKPGTAAATFSTTVVDAGTASDDVVYFTLTPGTHTPVLTSTGTWISTNATTGVKVYSATANAAGLASVTVTSSITTDLTTYTVAATSNGQNATGGSDLATYTAPAAASFSTTNTVSELNPTVPTTGTGSVTIKGKLADQYGIGFQPTALTTTVNVDTSNVTYTTADATGVAAIAADGTFSFVYVPTVAPIAGQTDSIQFVSGVSNPATATPSDPQFHIAWTSSAAAATLTLTAPVDPTTGALLHSAIATPVLGIAVAGTVLDSTSAGLGNKKVTLSGGDGVYFSTLVAPTAAAPLTKTLDVVSNSVGAFGSAFVFYTKAGTVKVTATSGAATKSSTVTTVANAIAAQAYWITINDVSGEPGSTLGITGTVVDGFGNPVVGETVALSVGVTTVGSLATSSPVTNAAGVFSTTFLSGSSVTGTNVLDLTASLTTPASQAVLIPHANWLVAGVTLDAGLFTATGKITIKADTLTLMSTGTLVGGGMAELSGEAKPNATITVFAKPSGGSFGVLTVVSADSEGQWGYATSIKKSTSFYVQSGTLTSTVATTVVNSKVTLTAKAYKKGYALLSANGAPSAKGTLTFYRSVGGPDIKLKTMISNASGNGAVIVKLPKGTRSVYAKFKAPGTGTGMSMIVMVKVK
jgi:hypothetical protein